MDSFEFNKYAGAVLMTLLIVTVIGHVGDILVPEPEAGHGIAVAATTAKPAATQQAAAPAELKPIAPFLAKASLQDGAKTIKKCETCHNVEKGKGAKIGPDLYGIVGAKVATRENFQYSDGLKKLGGEWTFDMLNKWIDNPHKLVAGTKMTFPGIKDEQERANVIAYLNSKSDSPVPLPK